VAGVVRMNRESFPATPLRVEPEAGGVGEKTDRYVSASDNPSAPYSKCYICLRCSVVLNFARLWNEATVAERGACIEERAAGNYIELPECECGERLGITQEPLQ
jgi:hypothetical protein